MKIPSLILLLVICLIGIQLSAQNPYRTGKDYALFLAVSDFDHWDSFDSVSQLQIRQVADQLGKHYNFEIDTVWNPTKKMITNQLVAYQKKVFQPEDQLLIYLSMHGHYEKNATGSLIPKDGLKEDPAYETWIPHSLLEVLVNKIPCEHILLSIDACYSGTFGGTRGIPTPSSDDCPTRIKNALSEKSRLYLTSGGKLRTPINSEFAKKWLVGLSRPGDTGVIGYYELMGVLSKADPAPKSGAFGNIPDGDFVFVHKNACQEDSNEDEADWKYLIDNKRLNSQNFRDHTKKFPSCKHINEGQELLDKKIKVEDLSTMVSINQAVLIQNTKEINTSGDDMSPAYFQDGIVYVSYKKKRKNRKKGSSKKLYFAKVDMEGFPVDIREFSDELNVKDDFDHVTFDRTGEQMFYSVAPNLFEEKARNQYTFKLFESIRISEGGWEYKWGFPCNTEDWNTRHPSLSIDGTKLYFASDRPGGYGGYDLWYTESQNGVWSIPFNLGPKINSPKDELFPHLHAEGILFYASNGHTGFGGLDMFMVDLNAEYLEEPINMGLPYNSPRDDFGFIANRDLTVAFFVSDRRGGSGKNDIYKSYGNNEQLIKLNR